MQEFYIAHQRVTEGNPTFLIPILLEDMPMEELPRDMQMYLRTYTYIDAREYDTDTLRKRIRFAMPDTPYKVLLRNRQVNDDGEDTHLLQGIELGNNEQDIAQEEGVGGILRLLQGDGSILHVPFPARLQTESDYSDESDSNSDSYSGDNYGDHSGGYSDHNSGDNYGEAEDIV